MDKLLPGHHSGLCSAPQVSLWFWSGIAVGFLLLSHFLIQSESAFLPQGVHQGIIEGDFALCISLYHGYELLLQMGIRSLFIYLWGIMDGSKGEMSLGAFLPFSSALLISFPSLYGWFGTKQLRERGVAGGIGVLFPLC